jgi:WD40 repeat protein
MQVTHARVVFLCLCSPQLTYWDVVEGNPIRIIDGSPSDAINTLAVTKDGNTFVSGGGDKLCKVYCAVALLILSALSFCWTLA